MTSRNGNAPTKPSEAATPPQPSTPVCGATLNVFADSSEGFSCHVQITVPDAAKSVSNLAILTKALADAGFKPRIGGDVTTNSGPTCPEHGKAKKSQHGDGYFCPQKLDDGSYCKWRHEPGK